MNGTVRVTGGRRLKGEVVPIPNKNTLVAALPAAVLSTEEVFFREMPQTSDVVKLLTIIKQLGGEVVEDGAGVRVNCKKVFSYRINEELGGQFRASFMFAGPLLARFGIAEVPMPGGCDLGMRSIEAHTNAFSRVGVEIKRVGNFVRFVAPKVKKRQYRVWQIEASVTATENLAMYAAGINAETEIIDAACEPHVTDILNLLKSMGANISGIGSNHLMIKGLRKMRRAVFRSRPDLVDIVGYIVAAAITDGEIRIMGANVPDIVDGVINWFLMFNVEIERMGRDILVRRGKGGLIIDVARSGFPLAAPNLPKLAPRPWPGFPVDAIPVMATLASKSAGRLLLQNWMYESGFDFVRELNALGADIFMIDPQRIIINGPVKFKGGEILPPPVIQSVKAVFLAALADPVTTTIHGTDILKRRYPNIIEVYRNLGAKIEIVDEETRATAAKS